MLRRVTVRLSEDLLKRAKALVSRQHRTLDDLIEEGLRAVLRNRDEPSSKIRKLPRVSSATGGLMPGVNIGDSAALQEMDDLEFIARSTKPG